MMENKKKYYKGIDLVRVFACISILLYHLDILKGGYLAVCIFFVLSGYLSCLSVIKKKNFSILEYYHNKLMKIYLPLVVSVFVIVPLAGMIPDFIFLNLKPEVTSILLGYNNFWQLGASLDYFARHIDSPFMHLWYIAILMQFDLIFPFIYLFFKKVVKKFNKAIPSIICSVIGLTSFVYLCITFFNENIMGAYYNTFGRIFSLLLGLALGYVHAYYKPFITKSLVKKKNRKRVFLGYLLILLLLFIFTSSISMVMPLAMFIVTLITCRLVDYASSDRGRNKTTLFGKIVKFLSSISYEIYLFQYPVIFMFQYTKISIYFKIPIIIIVTFIISCLIYFAFNYKNENKKLRILMYILNVFILIVYLWGIIVYVTSKDYTEEMKKLEDQLTENSLIVKQKQEEYAKRIKNEETEWEEKLESLEINEDDIKNLVSNLNVVGIGDSVMLGAIQNLYQQFPNGYFDAEVSRTAWVVNGIIQNLKNSNLLGNPVVINLGVNGDCSLDCKKEIIASLGDRKIFWVNVNGGNDFGFNNAIISLANEYDNLYIVDWQSASFGHPEYFVADGIHLTSSGRDAYTKTIYDTIYSVYLKEYEDKIDDIVKEHEKEKKEMITFYGNDLLLGAFDYMKEDFSKAKFITDKEFSYSKLRKEIIKEINDNSLNYNIVFVFDSKAKLTSKEYSELIDLCKDYKIYITDLYGNLSDINYDNVSIIDFKKELSSFLMADRVHLTSSGNEYLASILKDNLLLE